MGELSWWHWLIIIAAFILIFGAKKLPDAARGVGRSLRILKSEVAAMHEDDNAPDSSAVTSEPAPSGVPGPGIAVTDAGMIGVVNAGIGDAAAAAEAAVAAADPVTGAGPVAAGSAASSAAPL